jgi:NAD(P)-dependent dehydrogenase (short-subunit alcohol dehydrogenase family)
MGGPVDILVNNAGMEYTKNFLETTEREIDDVIRLIRANTLGEHFGDQLHPYVQPKFRELWGYAQRPSDLPE